MLSRMPRLLSHTPLSIRKPIVVTGSEQSDKAVQ
jgi:hypothetical protein